jgi:hypothetical protein
MDGKRRGRYEICQRFEKEYKHHIKVSLFL